MPSGSSLSSSDDTPLSLSVANGTTTVSAQIGRCDVIKLLNRHAQARRRAHSTARRLRRLQQSHMISFKSGDKSCCKRYAAKSSRPSAILSMVRWKSRRHGSFFTTAHRYYSTTRRTGCNAALTSRVHSCNLDTTSMRILFARLYHFCSLLGLSKAYFAFLAASVSLLSVFTSVIPRSSTEFFLSQLNRRCTH